jgi:hypothetical protein
VERKKEETALVSDTVGLDWVSRVRPRCVDFVGLAMAEWKKKGFGVRVLFFLFWLIGEKERRKGAGRRHRLSRRFGLGVACYGFFFLLLFFVLIGCSCSHFNFLYFS